MCTDDDKDEDLIELVKERLANPGKIIRVTLDELRSLEDDGSE